MLTPAIRSPSGGGGWHLQLAGPAKADLAAEKTGLALSLRVPGLESWHVQLHQDGLAFGADHLYTLTLTLRADHPLILSIQAAQAHAPWTSLWSEKVSVGTEWQKITLVFRPSAGDAAARLTLGGLGSETGQLFVGQASLRPGGIVGLGPNESLVRGTIGIFDFSTQSNRTIAAQRDWLNFLWDVENSYWREMQRFLKFDLGVRPVLLGTQVSFSPGAIQSMFDDVDDHAYWQQPQFPGKYWDMDNWVIQNSPMAGLEGGGTIADLAFHRVPGKPFTVTEYNQPAPSSYQGETLPLAAAYAALQDWDGLFLFSFGAREQNWQMNFIGNFYDSHANPVKMASLIATAALLRRGDVAAAAPTTETLPDRSTWIEAIREKRYIPGADALGAPRNAALAHWVSAATSSNTVSPALPVVSETGELVWGLNGVSGKTVVIDSFRSKGLIGARLGRPYDAHGVGLELTQARNDWGVLLATAMDGRDFSSPGRILVTTLGQEENSDQHWLNAQKTTIGRNFGTAPVRIEGVGARLTLPVPAGRVTAWALDAQGGRKAEVPVSGTAQATIEVGEQYQTLWYEIDIR